MMQKIRKSEKDKKAFVQDMLEVAHRDGASVDSIEFVIKIS